MNKGAKLMSGLQIQVKDFYKGDLGEVLDLSSDVFGADVRVDVLARVVRWQLAKRRSGNHKTKGMGEVSGTTKKPYKQKGTGRARQGSLRSPQFRGGGVVFGPVVRSHAFSLQKKVRVLGLKSALSSRLKSQALSVVSDLRLESAKTTHVLVALKNLGLFTEEAKGKNPSVLIVTGSEVCPQLKRAVSNLVGVDVLPQHGINVYDILKHRHLVMSCESISYLKERFS